LGIKYSYLWTGIELTIIGIITNSKYICKYKYQVIVAAEAQALVLNQWEGQPSIHLQALVTLADCGYPV